MSDEEPRSDIAVASAKVAAIVEAAERAAQDLRLQTEERARERIAEADRAATLRVEAAEGEALDIIAAAEAHAAAQRAEATEAVRHIHERAGQAREDAERRRQEAMDEARQEHERLRKEADAYADDVRRSARADAREIINEAHEAARGVLNDGTKLSGHLEELSGSLQRNAARLLTDVKLAHARLTADLDQATPAGSAEPVRASRGPDRAATAGPETDFDVPEFLPRRR